MKTTAVIVLSFSLCLGAFIGRAETNPREQLIELIKGRSFTIENVQMLDANQSWIFLGMPNNALVVSGDDLVFQTSFTGLDVAGMPQDNGLGGMTLVGRILNYQINNLDKKGILNVNILASTKTFGHITFNVSFYNDRTTRTIVRGFDGLKMFLQGNVEENKTLRYEAVPTFD